MDICMDIDIESNVVYVFFPIYNNIPISHVCICIYPIPNVQYISNTV